MLFSSIKSRSGITSFLRILYALSIPNGTGFKLQLYPTLGSKSPDHPFFPWAWPVQCPEPWDHSYNYNWLPGPNTLGRNCSGFQASGNMHTTLPKSQPAPQDPATPIDSKDRDMKSPPQLLWACMLRPNVVSVTWGPCRPNIQRHHLS